VTSVRVCQFVGYPEVVTQADNETHESLQEALARVGIVVTEAGKARARRRLAEARAEWPPERRAALREKLGRAPRPGSGE
jgi:hypothetical protein